MNACSVLSECACDVRSVLSFRSLSVRANKKSDKVDNVKLAADLKKCPIY